MLEKVCMDINKIKFIGRYALIDNYYRFFNGGTGFSFKMKGTGFSITLSCGADEGYFYIIVDHDYASKVKKEVTGKPIEFSFNKEGIHFVDIIKVNETVHNTLTLIDLDIHGEQLDFDYHYFKKVKVYGDSTIAGYGLLAHDGPGSVHNSDAVRDFCFHALYELNADMDIFSAAGWGLTFSIYTVPNNVGIIDYIDKCAIYKSNVWKDESGCDLLIVSVGTNDHSYIQEGLISREEGVDQFVNKYQELIESEIRYNKDLKILIVYGTLLEEETYYLNEEVYKRLKPIYPNLYIHKFHGDNTGISHHAYIDQHDKMSEELKAVIKEIL